MSLTSSPARVETASPTFDVVHTPSEGSGFGPRAWGALGAELIRSRELIYQLFRRNMIARYRQSIFGYLWAVVPSLVVVATFSYLNRSQLVPIAGTDLPYPLHVLLGMTVWQFFTDGISRAAQTMVSSWSLVTKINFAKEALVFASIGEALVDFLIRMVLISAMFAWYSVVPPWTILLTPLVMVPVVLLTAGVGLVVALVNSVFRDIASMLPLLMTVGILFAPIVYPPPTTWPAVLVNYLNPVSPFLIVFRDLASRGALSHPEALAAGTLVAAALFVLGLRVFHVGIARVIERV